MDESSTTQKRRSRRSQLLMTATLEIAGRALDVKLRNLSSDGARVEGDQLPIEGTDLMFRKGEIAVGGRVIWSKGRQAGIGFANKLDPIQVLNHISTPRARVKPEYRRPGLAARELTDVERNLGERWAQIVPVPPLGD